MISFFEASLRSLSVHRVGNKTQDEFYVVSDKPSELDESQSALLMHYFLTPFQKENEGFNFFHPSDDLNLNTIANHAKLAFSSWPEDFHWITQRITQHLYEVSNHPKIKGGELYVAYFENIQFEGELLSAIGIFKSEIKETYLTVLPKVDGFELNFEQDAINISSLDKGVLIFNTDAEKGYKVVCTGKATKESSYWKDEFLQLKVVNNQFNMTSNILSVCKSFIHDKLDEEFELSQSDKADLLNRSAKYFKEKESFDLDEFANEVINNADGINSFKQYKSIYDEEFDANIPDSFDISGPAVRQHLRSFKSIIKLDKNFQIQVTGSKELIERGFDGDKGLNYYKVYFQEES